MTKETSLGAKRIWCLGLLIQKDLHGKWSAERDALRIEIQTDGDEDDPDYEAILWGPSFSVFGPQAKSIQAACLGLEVAMSSIGIIAELGGSLGKALEEREFFANEYLKAKKPK